MGLFKDICTKFGIDGELEQQAEAFVKDKLFGDDDQPEAQQDGEQPQEDQQDE